MSSFPRKRVLIAVAAVAVIVGMIVATVVTGMVRTEDQRARADEAANAAEQLCEQVERAGGLCVVDPSELRGDTGPAGPPGEPGRGIDSAKCVSGTWTVMYSDGQVDVNAGPCTGARGPAGPSGEPGEDGRDGVDGQPGAQGDPGPAGPSGPAGPQGDDGRSIVDANCDPDTGRWEISYSDGSIDSDAGPCM